MTNAKRKGMGLFSTVFVVLLILKLCGVAAISWWWVFAPLMFSVALGALVLAIMAMLGIVVWLADDNKRVR